MNKRNFISPFILMALAFIVFSCADDSEEVPATPDPAANFTFQVSDTNPLSVTFTNTSTDAETYTWDFGDDHTSTGKDPVHVYTEAGAHEVILIARNGDKTAEVTKTVTIEEDESPVPVADFTFEVHEDNSLSVTFTNTTVDGISYVWNFGDGNTSTEESPTHTYDDGGEFSVTLMAQNRSKSHTATKAVTVVEEPEVVLSSLMLFDFETAPAEWSVFNGGAYEFVDNPAVEGINTSAKVIKINAAQGELYAGAKSGAVNPAIDVDKYNRMTMKVWAPTAGRLQFKMENATDWANDFGTMFDIAESDTNKWIEVSLDLTDAGTEEGKPGPFARVAIIPAHGSEESGEYFFDDIQLLEVE